MRLRENLRQYVKDTNAEAAATGWPMVRAMILAFPQDPGCSGRDVEDQFMFGNDWLVAPQYTYQAASRSVYLPPAPANMSWVYFFTETDAGAGGKRVDVPTPIDEFPLFYLRPIPPLVPTTANVTNFFSASRGDSVACLDAQCYNDNTPGTEGNYQSLGFVEGIAQVKDGATNINGKSYNFTLLPLNLFFSFTHNDNFVSTNTTPPDESYTVKGGGEWGGLCSPPFFCVRCGGRHLIRVHPSHSLLTPPPSLPRFPFSGVNFANGWAFAPPGPQGALPLQIWFKKLAGAGQDYATVASPQGVAWCKANGYSFVKLDGGFILPTGWSAT